MYGASDPSPEQRHVIEHDVRGGHLLILARPGSGKTYTLTQRVRRLLQEGVDPQQILAMTFSRRAAEELANRLPDGRIRAGTFHAICADILERDGAAIGVRSPFRILDDARRREFLARAVMHSGLPMPPSDRDRATVLRKFGDKIEYRKRLGLDRVEPAAGDTFDLELAVKVDECYCQLLREANALDFQDLIFHAVQLLQGDDRVASDIRSRISHLLVDEFHDISADQYRLTMLLSPPRASGQTFVVADPDQAIYGWRGADAARMLRQYRADYRPDQFELTVNYRSVPPIVAAADTLMRDLGRTRPSVPKRQGTVRPMWCSFADHTREARAIVETINRAMASGRYASHGAFAVLYRGHAIGDAVESELLRAGLPLWRVQNDRFFDDQDARESLRYLELAYGLQAVEFEPALNWPRVIVDELTMVHLRCVAARRGLRLNELVRRVDEVRGAISPLTVHAMREFTSLVDQELRLLSDMAMPEALEPFLALLAARQSPIPRAERALLRDTMDLLESPLLAAATRLHDAILGDRPIVVRIQGGLDAVAAGLIVEHCLRDYFGKTMADESRASTDPFTVTLGEELPASADGIGIGALRTRTVDLSVGTRASRLMQLVLMARETLDRGPFLLLDTETGSTRIDRAEILEIGVVSFVDGETRGEPIGRLMRPTGPEAVEPSATDIHGLRWRDVADAPDAKDVLPEVLAEIGEKIVVGHNIVEFDLPILKRTAERAGVPFHQPFAIDTLRMAERAWPGEMSYRLLDLARKSDPEVNQRHRAVADCRLTGAVFAALLTASRRDREIDVLTECLPLVAASIVASGFDIVNDNALLVGLGGRALRLAQGEDLFAAWQARAGADESALAIETMRAAERPAPEEDERWARLSGGWRATVAAFAAGEPDPGIGHFLRYAALAQPIDAPPPETDDEDTTDLRRLARGERVALMTVHSAKGLEWQVVFLVGTEDDQFPHWLSQDDASMAEERRLLYVAMTRARDRLIMFSARRRNEYAKQRSRFLEPLLGTVVEVMRESPADSG